ncbi:effector-associated constant component EACC1 [Streptomyces tanashiensis]|uniref:effector-associated constant component EACC1 n=1 Tax=Streptomyces tanashiensis TaxID=67367 RepID=UPI00341BC36D
MDESVQIFIHVPQDLAEEASSLDDWLITHPAIATNPHITTALSDTPTEDMDGVAIASLVISSVALVPAVFQAVLSFLEWQGSRSEPPPITLTSSLGGEAELVHADDGDLEAQAHEATAGLTRTQEG